MCPSPSASQGSQHDNNMQLRRDAYIRVADGLWREPEHILPMAEYSDQLRDGVKQTQKTGFFKRGTTVRGVGAVCVAAFIKGALGRGQKGLEMLKFVENDALRRLLIFGLNAALCSNIRGGCEVQQVMAAALNICFELAGARCSQLGRFGAFQDSRSVV